MRQDIQTTLRICLLNIGQRTMVQAYLRRQSFYQKGQGLFDLEKILSIINEGRFFSSSGTSYEQFSLPYTPTVMREYEVLQDVLSYKGIASPWFGQPGGGIQYRFDNVAIDLLKWRIIK